MRVQKFFILLLVVSIFQATLIQSLSSGTTSISSGQALISEERDQRFRKEQYSSMFSQSYSTILDSLRTRKIKISPVHAVSHRQVPTGPNPLHN